MTTLTAPDGASYHLRRLIPTDEALLAEYFVSLSDETRARYGPHPLTAEYAAELCCKTEDTADRYVLLTANQDAIIGYFILDYRVSAAEAERYRAYGIELAADLDPRFAPSIADRYQNRGLASLAMPALIEAARARGARSIVLMWGTQATNARAIAFYRKFGFQYHGSFQTEVDNHDMRLLLD